MPSYLHPGVYIEEIPSGSKPMTMLSMGFAAWAAVFIGYTLQGPIGEAELIHKWDDYADGYGGVSSATDAMGLSVNSFYLIELNLPDIQFCITNVTISVL